MAEIRAPITGSVFQVNATVGDTVAEGDLVAVIESMKLEIPVEAELSGTVTEVRVGVGDSVGEDDVLFTVD